MLATRSAEKQVWMRDLWKKAEERVPFSSVLANTRQGIVAEDSGCGATSAPTESGNGDSPRMTSHKGSRQREVEQQIRLLKKKGKSAKEICVSLDFNGYSPSDVPRATWGRLPSFGKCYASLSEWQRHNFRSWLSKRANGR